MDAMYMGLLAVLGLVMAGLVIGCDHLLKRDSRGRGSSSTGPRP